MWSLNRQPHFILLAFDGIILLLDLQNLILVTNLHVISYISIKHIGILGFIPALLGLHLSMGPAWCYT